MELSLCDSTRTHTVSPLGYPVWGLAGSILLLALLHLPGGPGTQGENLPTLRNLYGPFDQRNYYLIEQENSSFLTSPHPPLKSLLVERLFLSFPWSSMKINGFPLLCLLLSFLHTYPLMKTLIGLKLLSQLGHVRQVREVSFVPSTPCVELGRLNPTPPSSPFTRDVWEAGRIVIWLSYAKPLFPKYRWWGRRWIIKF